MKTRYLLGNMKALKEIGRASLFLWNYIVYLIHFQVTIYTSDCIQDKLICVTSSKTIIVINLQKIVLCRIGIFDTVRINSK